MRYLRFPLVLLIIAAVSLLSMSWSNVRASQDSDGDDYTDSVEEYIGTDPLLACGPDAWPPDFNNDQVVNILDIVKLMPPIFLVDRFSPLYVQRYDLNADGMINILDIVKLTPPTFNSTCTP